MFMMIGGLISVIKMALNYFPYTNWPHSFFHIPDDVPRGLGPSRRDI